MYDYKTFSSRHIPPAFYERDGQLYQPPSVQMKLLALGEDADGGQRRAR